MVTFNKPTLVTVTAPTCSGKNYLINQLVASRGFNRIVSTTTRKPRSGEVHGKDYFFVSQSEFDRQKASNWFAEYNQFNGSWYGVSKNILNQTITASNLPVLILDPNGVSTYKEICKAGGFDIFTIYVSTVENTRIERLIRRAIAGVTKGQNLEAIINDTMNRYTSIIGQERRWSNTNVWDAIVPGDNIEEAVKMIDQGIQWRNQRYDTPVSSRLNRFVI